jgi:hypothetical protein
MCRIVREISVDPNGSFAHRNRKCRGRMLLVAFAQFLGVTLWLSATAAAPALAAELALMLWAC